MKKIYIAMAVLATAALTSCVQEQSFNDNTGKGEVAFVLQAGPSTKAAGADSPVRKGACIQIGEVGNQCIILEETITDLSFVSPATKGTPVYTQNVGTLYKDQLGVYTNYADFEETTYETEGETTTNGAVTGWRFFHRYDNVPWPEDAVDFYMRMPADAIVIPDDGYSDGKITFEYTSPDNAEDQQDLIFAYASITEAQHNAKLSEGGYPVTFYHALTGVKFAIGNSADELKSIANGGKGIAITGIQFTNLANTGTCVVNPSATGNNPKVSWNATVTANNVISQSFTADENVITYSKSTDTNNFDDSFYAAGNTQNVNTADASYTFWLIPQSFGSSSNAVLRISYTINNHPEYLDISLKDIIKTSTGTPIEWAAGQLRTFTVKLDEVNVKITDDVEIAGDAHDGYSGSTKSNVKIQNTGDTDAFIRAAIVGQWLDSENNPVFGFTDNINNLYIVESWYEDQFVKEEAGTHGTFVGLPGYKGADTFKADGGSDATAGWQLCTDGYYYYTKIVAPNAFTGSDLFTSYTTQIVPAAIIAGVVMDASQMHFVLEISTQAITAVKMDGHEGSRYTWKQAWANATGIEPVEK